jgi:hypothetical protein
MAFKHYISLGSYCETAFQIRRRRNVTQAHFFDWLVTPLESLMLVLENDFEGVFERENIHPTKDGQSVVDTSNGLLFHHEFTRNDQGLVTEEVIGREYRIKQAKVQFLIDRWREIAGGSDPVLYVFLGDGAPSQIQDLRNLIRRKYPALDFRLLWARRPGSPGFDNESEGIIQTVVVPAVVPPGSPIQWQGDDASWDAAFDEAERKWEDNGPFQLQGKSDGGLHPGDRLNGKGNAAVRCDVLPTAGHTMAPGVQKDRLDDLGVRFNTDKSSTHHDFLDLYEERLTKFRNEPVILFEFGVYNGGSLQMWSEFFPRATIVGGDVSTEPYRDLGPRICVRHGDASNPEFLARLLAEFGRPDIVIDDASHRWDHQIATLQFLFPSLVPGGIYIVEDIDTSFPGHGNAFSGHSTLTAFEYLCRLARVVAAAGALGSESPVDLFAATASSTIRSIEFAARTSLITKR